LFIITCLWTSFFACILGCGAICGAIPQNVGFSATKIRKKNDKSNYFCPLLITILTSKHNHHIATPLFQNAGFLGWGGYMNFFEIFLF